MRYLYECVPVYTEITKIDSLKTFENNKYDKQKTHPNRMRSRWLFEKLNDEWFDFRKERVTIVTAHFHFDWF